MHSCAMYFHNSWQSGTNSEQHAPDVLQLTQIYSKNNFEVQKKMHGLFDLLFCMNLTKSLKRNKKCNNQYTLQALLSSTFLLGTCFLF